MYLNSLPNAKLTSEYIRLLNLNTSDSGLHHTIDRRLGGIGRVVPIVRLLSLFLAKHVVAQA